MRVWIYFALSSYSFGTIFGIFSFDISNLLSSLLGFSSIAGSLSSSEFYEDIDSDKDELRSLTDPSLWSDIFFWYFKNFDKSAELVFKDVGIWLLVVWHE